MIGERAEHVISSQVKLVPPSSLPKRRVRHHRLIQNHFPSSQVRGLRERQRNLVEKNPRKRDRSQGGICLAVVARQTAPSCPRYGRSAIAALPPTSLALSHTSHVRERGSLLLRP